LLPLFLSHLNIIVMKSLLFLLLLPLVLMGQADYQTILPDAVALYKAQNAFSVYDYRDSIKHIRGVKVTNTVYSDDFTTYKFFHEYHDDQYIINDYCNLFNTCFNMDAQCWLGSSVVVYDNGLNVFFNRNNDSLFIDTRAGLNDSWVFYQPDTGVVYTAMVTDISEAEFLGVTDQVKTITITGNDKTYTLEISQKHGFVKTINFRDFPGFGEDTYQVDEHDLVGLSNPVLGLQLLNTRDYFDFNIGDEFHHSLYVGSNGGGYYSGFRTEKVLSKQVVDQDHFKYTIELYEWGTISDPDGGGYVFKHDTIVKTYPDLILSEDINKMPFENLDTVDPRRYFLTNEGFNGRQSKMFGNRILQKTDSCFQVGLCEGSGEYFWIEGAGYSFNSYNAETGEWDEALVYFKKGDETWGNELVPPVSVPEIQSPHLTQVYPNPANNFVYVKLTHFKTGSHARISIIDLKGRSVYRGSFNSDKLKIDVNDWPGGIFIFKIRANGFETNGKFIVNH